MHAVEMLFSRQHKTFLNLAISMVHDREAAEDIVYDSFMALWQRREDIEDYVDYLFITIRNNCLRYRRDSIIHKSVYDKIAKKEQGLMELYTKTIENSDLANLQEKDISKIINTELSRLSLKDRKIFMMKKFDCMSYKEISEEIDVSQSVIDHSLRNTLSRMRTALADYLPAMLCIAALLEHHV